MNLKETDDLIRPLVEFNQLRWQTVKHADGSTHRRIAWRRPDPKERETEASGGVEVVRDRRILPGIGREFMPPLDEGSFLYMPSLLPRAGLGPALETNARQDMAIASVPEVESVVGKLGRAESALDPAPIGMMESIIILRPELEWRHIAVKRWFSHWPEWLKKPLTWVWPEHRRISKSEILTELQEKTAIPGVLPTFLQPIQTRLVMLQTGFRAMMGVKIYGSDLNEIERISLGMERPIRKPGSRHGPHAGPRAGVSVHHVRDALPRLQTLVDRARHLFRNPCLGIRRIHHARALGGESLRRRLGRVPRIVRGSGR